MIALALAGCGGGGGGDAAAVRTVVKRWSAAVVQRDNAAACADLSVRLREAIDRHLLGEGVQGKCRDWAARWVSPRHPASRRGERITSIRVSGRRASVSVEAPGVPGGHAALIREQGDWRIDDF